MTTADVSTAALGSATEFERSLHNWPLWPMGGSQVGRLAGYVDSRHVERLGLIHDGANYAARRLEPTRHNAAIVEQLFESLAHRGYAYDIEPYRHGFGAGQHVLHPTDVDRRRAGTCIDLAVLFASVLLRASIAPILVVGRRDRRSHPHVWVVADLTRRPGDLTRLDRQATRRCREGIYDLESESGLSWFRGRVEAGELQAVDVAAATRGYDRGDGRDFVQACEWASEDMAFPELWAADVAVRHVVEAPYQGLDQSQRPTISRLLPARAPVDDIRAGEHRPEAGWSVEGLAGRGGRLAVVGESGMGKSKLALDIAARAAGGYGWFLNGSSRAELIQSLAEAEAIHEYGTSDNVVPAQFEQLAAGARRRLADSSIPWVIVIDNADLRSGESPDTILDLVPDPDPRVGQMVVVTSTAQDQWATSRVDDVVTLQPLEEIPRSVDEALSINGRPLFITAFTKLAESVGLTLGELSDNLTPMSSDELAGSTFWKGFLSAADRTQAVVELAQAMAWCPPDRVVLTEVSSAVGADMSDIDTLVSAGVIERDSDRTARIHRLMAAAIRADLLARGGPAMAATSMSAVLRSGHPLDNSSFDLMRQTLEALHSNGAGGPEVAAALCDLGMRSEVIAGVGVGAELMERALPGLAPGDRRRQADCRHVIGRDYFQRGTTPEALRSAEALLDECIIHRQAAMTAESDTDSKIGRQVEYWMSVALQGLIVVRQVSRRLSEPGAELDSTERASEIQRARLAMDRVDRSLAERELLSDDRLDPEVVRGYFNQGSNGISAAKMENDPDERARLLEGALEAYRDTGRRREQMRPPAPAPHIAACYHGAAIALYLLAAQHRGPLAQRDRLLREATSEVGRALNLREQVESVDGNDVAKSLALLSKVALARLQISETERAVEASQAERLLRQLAVEIEGFDQVLGAAVDRLHEGSD